MSEPPQRLIGGAISDYLERLWSDCRRSDQRLSRATVERLIGGAISDYQANSRLVTLSFTRLSAHCV
ncbi:MAG: hypothetical protein KDA51_02305 [Planctomycetales bacterium]|nr:hypothetical protein [Planctomycetales bacterium]